MKSNNKEKSPELWRMYLTEFWANQGGGWRSMPRFVSHSENFIKLSDQAARLMIYLWDQLWLDKENRGLVHDGVVSMPRNRLIALGLLVENIDSAMAEIVKAGFFTQIGPDTFRLNDEWRK